MTEKTTEKIIEVKSTVSTYIAEDGKEFSSKDKCITYENELFLNHYAEKYKMKFILVPTFICDDDHVRGVSFYFPQDGDIKEVIKLLSIFQNYEISKKCGGWEISWDRELNNVRNSDFEIKMPSLIKEENYIFYFCWQEQNDDYDNFYNRVVSKETAIIELKKEIKKFEVIFGTKFDEKYLNNRYLDGI